MTITITPLNLIGQDDRGPTYDFSMRANEDFILIYRKKGSMSGNTYHLGKSEKTNPKVFVLIQGSVKICARHIDAEQHEEFIVDQPSVIEVPVKTTHSFEALEDMIVLECNSAQDLEGDRFQAEVTNFTSHMLTNQS